MEQARRNGDRDLRSLLGDAGLSSGATADLPAAVCAVETDSRHVVPGTLFVAVSGVDQDGAAYVPDAVSRGAVAVIAERPLAADVPVVVVEDARAAAADLAAAYHGHPARSLRVAGITGTNGKTTTAWLLHGALEAAGRSSGLIGTVAYRVGERHLPAAHTTPGPVELQGLLAAMRDEGCSDTVMEVSSHALVQGRTRGVDFDVAIFTNLTQDHLDYHGSIEAYREAKAALFRGLSADSVACIHADDPHGDWFAKQTAARVKKYGIGADLEVGCEGLQSGPNGVEFTLKVGEERVAFSSPLLGRHNVENLLAAAAGAHGLGLPAELIASGLRKQPGVPGRLERVDDGSQGFRVVVDYAHTEDALRRVLGFLRPVTPGRLLVLCGCGGDRDREKRPRMARAMAEGADEAILTSDNPRSEDPGAILDEMKAGLPPGANATVVTDRREAIAEAVVRAQPGDTVLIAGKGHEAVQIIGPRRLPFDDREEARGALRALRSQPGPG
ncbi:MAG: UDP-N-acetylmuramoyl-L-alanyl-D-glutamate--2,6-diaminopimelate ligase [Planctomycetota bacterium]